MGRHQKAHRIRGVVAAGVLSLAGLAGVTWYTMQAPVAAPVRPHVHVQSPVPASIPPPSVTTPAEAIMSYPVRPGDSLWGIADNLCGNGTSEGKIAAANHMSLTAVLPVGKVLVIIC